MTQLVSKSCTIACALAAVLTLGAPAMVRAGEVRTDHGHNGACAGDIKAFCPDAKDRDDVRRCLHEHADQISPACAGKMEARRQRHIAVRNGCTADLTAFCPDAVGRDLHQCLHQHRSELSANCVQTLDSLRGHGG